MRVGDFPVGAAFPDVVAGRHPRLHFRGLLRLHTCYGLQGRSATLRGLRHKAPARPVTKPGRLSATRLTDNYLGGTSTHWRSAPLGRTQHSRLQRVTTFVFCNIPALLWAAEGRSFVFIDIPALVLHFWKLLVLSFPVGGDILSSAAVPAKNPLHPACLKCGSQSAVSRRQARVAKRKKVIHCSPLRLPPAPPLPSAKS